MESPGTSVPQAVSCCLSAGDPAWVPKEQLVLSHPLSPLSRPQKLLLIGRSSFSGRTLLKVLGASVTEVRRKAQTSFPARQLLSPTGRECEEGNEVGRESG